MNILLSSVGRRPYLVRWFQEALRVNGLDGRVIAADLDGLAPSRSVADDFLVAPPVTDPQYRNWLAQVLEDEEVQLAISINDFELSAWAHFGRQEQWKPLIRLAPEIQTLVEDKLAMSKSLAQSDISTPQTWLGGNVSEGIEAENEYVTKGRFGSASRGLHFAEGKRLKNSIEAATQEVTNSQGQLAIEQEEYSPSDLVIVQERIVGPEYGLDVVCDLNGDFAGVLARRKIAMRAGETDRAESVSPHLFEKVARSIAEVVPHPGTIDVDVITDSDGEIFVIDVNPRFGGGYPFSHLAGARVPNAYVGWAAGKSVPNDWLNYDPGVIGGKCVETVRIP